jgi:site-specific DNA-methyltransferase (adenine-specific)
MPEWLNKFHLGDCLDIMSRMPAESVDLVVTSPPYNLRNSSGGGMRNGSGGLWHNASLLKGYAGDYGDDMPRAEYIAWQRTCLTAMLRLLPDTGAIFYNHKRRVQDGLEEDPRVDILLGFPVRQTITWQRAGGINFNLSYFLPTTEVIYLICKTEKFRLTQGSDPTSPKAACGVGDVWSISQQDKKNGHPAPFPVDIPLRCIGSTDAKVVLDPFMGSGTTALAAEMLGRKWIGIEVAQTYVEQAERRLTDWRALPLEKRIDFEKMSKREERMHRMRAALKRDESEDIFDHMKILNEETKD